MPDLTDQSVLVEFVNNIHKKNWVETMRQKKSASLFKAVGLSGFLLLSGCAGLSDSKAESTTQNPRLNERIAISRDEFRLELAPRNGGSISGFTYSGQEIMRSAPDEPHDITQAASFPLVPIVNRIPEGKFEFGGLDVDLDGNFMGLPDFIHGHGWRGDWRVEHQTEHSISISYAHEADAWPWSYEARQKFELLSSGLHVELSVTNKSNSPMPAALGFHPYFPTTSETRLKAKYDGHWVNNEWGHVRHRIEGSYRKDFTKGADMIDSVMTDQTHYGWSGAAVLTEPGRPAISISASPVISNLHVFFPPNGNYVAIEPTYGRGDPFGTDPVEYTVLQPGESFSIWMQVDVG